MGLVVPLRFLKWKDGIVPFKIDESVKDKSGIIHIAMIRIEEETNVRFEEYKDHKDFVLFTKSSSESASSSAIGNALGRMQKVNLASWAGVGTVVHELGHALGLMHEQQRWDRNAHLKIMYRNIKFMYWGNFFRCPAPIFKMVGEFDPHSIMLYHGKAFSKNKEQTIWRINGHGELVKYTTNRRALSEGDIASLNYLYK